MLVKPGVNTAVTITYGTDLQFTVRYAFRIPRTAKADFADGQASFLALLEKYQTKPTLELYNGLQYMDAFLGASFHNAFPSTLGLSKREELDFMRDNKRRRSLLQPLPAHLSAFQSPKAMEDARTLADCIEEAKTILSSKRRAAANNRWKKHKSEKSKLTRS